MQVMGIEPRDVRFELDEPDYRVSFFEPDGRSDEHHLTGAPDVADVLGQWRMPVTELWRVLGMQVRSAGLGPGLVPDRKGARYARVAAAMALRATPAMIFRGKTRHLPGGRGKSRPTAEAS